MASQPSSDVIEQRIFDVLAQVPDPEIPAVSIVDLGIVRGVSIDGDQAASAVECLMSDSTMLDVTSWMPGNCDSFSKKNCS